MIIQEIQNIIYKKQDEIQILCQKYHIESLRIFGSAIRKDFTMNSDIDLLVEFKKEKIPGFIGFIKIQNEISKIFERHVDLNTPEDLHDFFKEKVNKEAERIYVAA
ncbi:MAG: nucleotidyltransferase domain-containing protein [Leptospiraceae bacterium]|nr:nucleotidyltransferase domain-containing protein [Leptospiraceae bacterium]